jgi:hypothetical protein
MKTWRDEMTERGEVLVFRSCSCGNADPQRFTVVTYQQVTPLMVMCHQCGTRQMIRIEKEER